MNHLRDLSSEKQE